MSNKQYKGQFLKKEQIAYWYPVSHEKAELIEESRQILSKVEKQYPIPQFQLIELMIEQGTEKMREISVKFDELKT